jgi:GT2 family glycosyltransferase
VTDPPDEAGQTAPLRGADVDVLIPTFDREAALAVTLTGILGQQEQPARIIVGDQTAAGTALHSPLVAGVARVLSARGVPVEIRQHPSGAGVAENRQFLLEAATAPYVLFLDDDIVLEPESMPRLLSAMTRLRTGLVGMAMTGLSFLEDRRPHEWSTFEPLAEGERPRPERIRKGEPAWERWRLHNAANPTHLADRLALARTSPSWVAYRIAWAAGCVLFEREALLETGGFSFWPEIGPRGYGEDVVAQLRVIERRGGVGLLPTGAHHLELPTSVGRREVDAYEVVLSAVGRSTP